MKQQMAYQPIDNRGIRFKNWSRKGYAVFSSLGRVVHIGNLSVALSQWIGQLVEHVEAILFQCLEVLTDATDELEEQEELVFVPVVIAQSEAGAYRNKVVRYNNCRH